MQHYDLIIMGGGPAGSMAALGALTENPACRVLIIEQHIPIGPKVGEALLTGTMEILERANLLDALAKIPFLRKKGATYRWGKYQQPWHVRYQYRPDFPSAFCHDDGIYALHIHRRTFDNWLLTQAQERGCQVYNATIADVKHVDDAIKYITTTKGERLYAQHWIDATGQAAILSRHLTRRLPLAKDRRACYGYWENVNWSRASQLGYEHNTTNIIANQHGWCWAIHLGEIADNRTSIGFITPAGLTDKLSLETIITYFPELQHVYGIDPKHHYLVNDRGEPLKEFIKQPEYSYYSARLDGKNWALVGDASVFIDPILSSGVTLAIHYGFQRGRHAVQRLAGHNYAQKGLSHSYINDINVLKRVVSHWYDSNSSEQDWKLAVSDITATTLNKQLSPDDAFLFLTNLEHL